LLILLALAAYVLLVIRQVPFDLQYTYYRR
jgi:hypothetical protein